MRYIVEGVAADVAAGKRVALVGKINDRGELRSLFTRVLDAVGPDSFERVRRGSGREQAWHVSGGSLRLLTPETIRGTVADVVVAIGWNGWSDWERIETLPATATGGELLRVG